MNGYIYIFTNDLLLEKKYYKLGKTNNIEKRLNQYQTYYPCTTSCILQSDLLFDNSFAVIKA